MKSKRVLWNKTIYWKDITRFWPLWVLEWIYLQLAVALPCFLGIRLKIKEADQLKWTEEIRRQMLQESVIESVDRICMPVLIAIFSIVTAVFLFSYLTKTREAYTIHSFPVKRETLFASHYLGGLTILAVPFVVTYFCIILMSMVNGIDMTGGILACMAETLIEILLFYNLACLVVMLTGNTIMTVLIYVVINVLYIGVTFLFSTLGSLFVYGLREVYLLEEHDIVKQLFTPVFYLDYFTGLNMVEKGAAGETGYSVWQMNWHGFGVVACYLVPAILFLVVAVILYQKRSLESAGDMVAFSWGRPVYRIVFTFSGSMFFTWLIYIICFEPVTNIYEYGKIFRILLVLLVTGCILCYFISNMILYRTFFIWKKTSYVRLVLIIVVMVCGMFYMKYGGYGLRVPKLDQAEEISLDIENDFDYHMLRVSDKNQIKQFMEIEKELIDWGRKQDFSGRDDITTIHIVYLKSGNAVRERGYPVLINSKIYQKIQQFISNPETICQMLFSSEYEKARADYMYLWNRGRSGGKNIKDDGEMQRLYQAVLNDLQAGHIVLGKTKKRIKGYLEIETYLPEETQPEKLDTVSICITDSCTDILNVLDDMDIDLNSLKSNSVHFVE